MGEKYRKILGKEEAKETVERKNWEIVNSPY